MTDTATGNERRPTVVRRYAGTCSSWDVDSANGGDQEGRRHEPTDPGMMVPYHVVHETLSQRL